MTKEKDPFKLTSINEDGSRIQIVPAEVRGRFRQWRTRVHAVLLFIFLVLPWVTINGHQAILFNISQREFNFFGLLFRSHDAPLIFLVLTILVMSLALVTAIWGRIWCGWACPQTVFIESVFRKIEFWVQGSYLERRRLLIEPWGVKDFTHHIIKWLLFTVVSSLIAHSFIAYFVGSENLMQMMKRAPAENWNYFLTVLFVTGLVLFDFGWFREQFCVIMCPYGRIQSVLLEPNSLAVAYDQNRSDCISCNRCVEVCPTGIDIRNGLQMECIACTACIDACDEIMTKVKKPTGLISYKTLNGAAIRFFKPKTIFNGLAILVATSVLAYTMIARDPLNIAVLRAIESPYATIKNGDGEELIQNHFRLHLTNQTNIATEYKIELSSASVAAGFSMILAQNPILLKSKSSETIHLFIHLVKTKISNLGRVALGIRLTNASGEIFERDLIFIGPTL